MVGGEAVFPVAGAPKNPMVRRKNRCKRAEQVLPLLMLVHLKKRTDTGEPPGGFLRPSGWRATTLLIMESTKLISWGKRRHGVPPRGST